MMTLLIERWKRDSFVKKSNMYRKALIFFSLIILAACSGDHGNESVLQEYLEAHNANDVDRTMELFHEKARLMRHGQSPTTDIRKLELWDAAIKSNLTYHDWEVRGDTIIVGRITERNNWINQGGIDKIEYKPGTRFVFREDKIYMISIAELTEESLKDLQQMFRDFLEWAYENKPGAIRELMPRGQFNFTEDNAKDWFLILDEWQRNK